jgi:hypothetical protein
MRQKASDRHESAREPFPASRHSDSGLARLCLKTLEGNWREGERDGRRYAYTAPSAGRYPWQWYWDSCFSAIAWRRFDRARARAELETLLAAATPEGFIGHTIF